MASAREETALRILVVGDRFIPAGYCVDALAKVCGPRFGPVRSVDWSGSRAEHHAAQQTMEWHGPGAVAVRGV
jgi:D-3-phosphoglycerate dehydrogenase